MSGEFPRRKDGLEINETHNGVIVYHESERRVARLNATAAIILELCDGTHSAEAIAAALAGLFELDELPIEETRGGLDILAAEGLLS